MERSEIAKRLARELASKGVPVLTLATNIFEDNYSAVHITKGTDGLVKVETECFVEDEDGRVDLKYTYHYDASRTLQRIDCTVAGRTEVYFDRQTHMGELAALLGLHNPAPNTTVEEYLLSRMKRGTPTQERGVKTP